MRNFFLSLSRMPPAVMLLIIIGLAVIVTMFVTGQAEHEEVLVASSVGARTSAQTRVQSSNRPLKTAYFSTTYIPSGSAIESKQIESRQIDELELWSDAVQAPADVVGHISTHAIPLNAQVRQSDLE